MKSCFVALLVACIALGCWAADDASFRLDLESPVHVNATRPAVGSIAALARAEKPAFKGMELYSWKPDGKDWHFSLRVGTNRVKTDEEIKKPEQMVIGAEELKKRLGMLAEGESVFWRNLGPDPIPENLATELKTFCDGIKVKLTQQ